MKRFLYPFILLLSLSVFNAYGQTDDGTVRVPKMRLALQEGSVFPGYSGRYTVPKNVYTTDRDGRFDDVLYDIAFTKRDRKGPVFAGDGAPPNSATRGRQFAIDKFMTNTGHPPLRECSLVIDYYPSDDLEIIYNVDKTDRLLKECLQKAEEKIEARYKETLDFIDISLSKYDLDRAVAERLSNDLRQHMTTEINIAIDREREKLKQELINDSTFLAELKKKMAAGN